MTYTPHIQVAVLGGGSWATALVKILCENPSVRVHWWLRSAADIEHLRTYRHNPRYLSDIYFPEERVTFYEDLPEAVQSTKYVVVAIPAAFVKDSLSALSAYDLNDKYVVSGVKGMVTNPYALITDWMQEAFLLPPEQLLVIAGPCHAEEIALEKQSYLSIASESMAAAASFCELMTNRFVAAHPVADLYGVEYAAIMKNIVALACGVTHGLGYGDNFQAVMVSNAMQEIGRFVTEMDPRARDLSASAYLGDLLVTAYSQFSRNRLFGTMLGRGYSVKAAQLEMKMVAEGYYATKGIFELSQERQIELPIVSAVHAILYQHTPPTTAIERLKHQLR